MLVQIGNNFYSLAEGLALPIQAGSTLRVFYSVNYKIAQTDSVPLWASLYTRTPLIGTINRVGAAQTKTSVLLKTALDWETYTGQVEIQIPSGLKAGTYGLIVESPGFKDGEDKIDDCLEVMAAPGLTEWMGPLMMLAMMGLVTQMMVPAAEGMGYG